MNRISEFALPIEVEVEPAQLDLSYLKDLWEKSQKGKVKVSVKGVCKLRKMAVPIKLPIDYTDNVDLNLPSLF